MDTRRRLRHRGEAQQRRPAPPGAPGFTLIEAVIALMLAVAILAGVLTLFDRNNQLARAQTYVAEMQNSVRVGQAELARYIRMAGRGGLPRGPLPTGLAIAVRNNTPEDGDQRYIAAGDADSPRVLPGTDVLTIRGAISNSVFQVNPLGGGFVLDDPEAPTLGTVRVDSPHSTTGVMQPLDPLIEAINNDPHAAILLVSPVDTWAVVEVDKNTSVTDDENSIVIGFKVGVVGGTEVRDRYLELSGGFPSTLRNVANVALLEEFRYYVREEHAVAGDDDSDYTPRLVKARFYPNTEIPHVDDPEFGSEVSDNIIDLQLALGIDADGDGDVAEGVEAGGGGGEPAEGAIDKAEDEWLFNVAGDYDGEGTATEDAKWNPGADTPPLAYIRVTTIARTDRRDIEYLAPLLVMSEDKDFDDSPYDVFNTLAERRFRRRQLQTVVDMRNLS
jgi:type II secretory pathway pseudopilin PulG